MKKLTTVMVLSLPLFLLPLHGADADSEPRERSIYGNTGVAAGGIAMANINGKFAVSLTPNTFSSNVSSALGSYKNDSVSQARDGTIAFSSNRGGKGWRIYAMRSDGSRQRQLTFSTPETLRADIGQWANDINPSISPDGKRIAFLSQRSAFVKSSPKSHYDLYVMNVDGSQVRRLTDVDYSPERNGYIRSAVFGPDSRRIAYRGNVVLNENGQVVNREVVGFINIDGSDPSYFVTNDCAGGAVLDWVGDALLYSYGGAVQGCEYMTKYIVRSLSSGESVIIPGETLGNFGMGGPAGAGAARLSPDGKRVVYTQGPPAGAPSSPTEVIRLGIDGSDRTAFTMGAFGPGQWIWISSKKIPQPTSLVMKPARLRIKKDGKPVQVEALLKDKKGNVISRSPVDWTWLNTYSPITISATGLLETNQNVTPGEFWLQVSNAGLTAKMSIKVID